MSHESVFVCSSVNPSFRYTRSQRWLIGFSWFYYFFHAVLEPESQKNADPNFENRSNESEGPKKSKKLPKNEICGVLTKIYSWDLFSIEHERTKSLLIFWKNYMPRKNLVLDFRLQKAHQIAQFFNKKYLPNGLIVWIYFCILV